MLFPVTVIGVSISVDMRKGAVLVKVSGADVNADAARMFNARMVSFMVMFVLCFVCWRLQQIFCEHKLELI